jgi:flagellar P-ring protein precursor FlgI
MMIIARLSTLFRLTARLVAGVLAASIALTPAAHARSRIKDIADFEGVRPNMLIGYGLVIGLNGTGDSINNAPFTQQSLIGMLERLGVNTRDIATSLRTKNVAAVMVTATLPAFARQGARIDVQVGAMGDATNLMGGVLLVTPMLGADGEVYAVAQGPVAIAGFAAQGQAQSVVRGVPTSARIPNGAIVERELPFQLGSLRSINISLRNPDLTTARRIAQAINQFVRAPAARSVDPRTVVLEVPPGRQGDLVNLLTDIEQLPIVPDQIARVVIDERSGTIVMGEAVRISTVAIAQGSLTIRITETPQVSQPNPFAPGPGVVQTQPGQLNPDLIVPNQPRPRVDANGRPVVDPTTGQPIIDFVPQAQAGSRQAPVPGAIAGGAATVVVPRTQIDIDDQSNRRLTVLPQSVTLQELVNGLNALGIGPRDLITILQAIKAAGALQAEIDVL